jgi:hypothetical protein
MHYLGAKQPAEKYYILWDFTNWLGSEDVSVATVVVVDQADNVDKTATLTDATKQAIAGKTVATWVQGGTTAHNYKFTCTITDTDGQVFELDAILPVVAT